MSVSFASVHYSNYSAFFSRISPGKDYWDRDIHAHTTEELLLLTCEGECTVVSNGSTYRIPTPAFLWNRAGSYHLVSDVNVVAQPSYVASFSPQVLTDIPKKQQFFDFIQGHALFAVPLTEARLDRLKLLFQVLLESPMPQRAPLLACIFHQVSLYLENGAEAICSSGSYSYIFRVLALLERPESRRLTTVCLAEQFHVSKAKLEKDFKRCTGHTIHAFRLRVQLQAARMQLSTTEKSLVQIANDSGFADESHLIRAFRKEYGVTPGIYRKNYKKRPH